MDDREQVNAVQPRPAEGTQAVRIDARGVANPLRIRRLLSQPWRVVDAWLERVDPGAHRRVKGLRLVTAYGLAAALGTLNDVTRVVDQGALLAPLAAGIALWASVSAASSTRAESSRDLALLCIASGIGAVVYVAVLPLLTGVGRVGPEITLISGAFCVGYLKRFGMLGAGIGSQIYLGQLYAYGTNLVPADLQAIGAAVLIAALASIVPRLLSGPAERPAALAALSPVPTVPAGFARRWPPELVMGLQAAAGAAAVVALNQVAGLEESVWAMTACTYVVAGSASDTAQRAQRRIIGTMIGVPLGLACLPLAEHAPLVIWSLAALAMIVYAMGMPDRYDIACGAFAFILIVTLAANGIHSVSHLFARLWETLIGGVLGLTAALLIFPLRSNREEK